MIRARSIGQPIGVGVATTPILPAGDVDVSPARMALIFLVAVVTIAGWLALRCITGALAQRRVARMDREVLKQVAPAHTNAAVRGRAEREALRYRFAEALALLGKPREGGRNLEGLPWYVLIGATGAGKTTLLGHSGFEFPLLQRTGKCLDGIGGTRQCDWWFTEQAIFLDTAGRFATQDMDPQTDAWAWDGFLDLLRRHRRRGPVNGVVLVVSAGALLTMTGTDRQLHARALRERIEDLGLRLGVPLPAYLVISKCDYVAGFAEFFAPLGPLERTGVWGATFAAEHSLDGSAPALLGVEFDALVEGVETDMPARLLAEKDMNRQALILGFPQQLRALRGLVLPLVSTIFGGHTRGYSPVLRGAYLTSATRPQRRAYFVERLFRETLLLDADFVRDHAVALQRRRIAEAVAMSNIGILG